MGVDDKERKKLNPAVYYCDDVKIYSARLRMTHLFLSQRYALFCLAEIKSDGLLHG